MTLLNCMTLLNRNVGLHGADGIRLGGSQAERVFRKYDLDGSGYIDGKELFLCLLMNGGNPHP